MKPKNKVEFTWPEMFMKIVTPQGQVFQAEMLDDGSLRPIGFECGYNIWLKKEEIYIKRQILKNRKWHSFWYFLRWIFTGKD